MTPYAEQLQMALDECESQLASAKAEVAELKTQIDISNTEWRLARDQAEAERDALREALVAIDSVVAEAYDGGPSDMTEEEKRWLGAFGKCVCIAKAALEGGEKKA